MSAVGHLQKLYFDKFGLSEDNFSRGRSNRSFATHIQAMPEDLPLNHGVYERKFDKGFALAARKTPTRYSDRQEDFDTTQGQACRCRGADEAQER